MRATRARAELGLLMLASGAAHGGPPCEMGWRPDPVGVPGLNQVARASVVFNDGTGAALYVGGPFATAGGVTVNSVGKWNGTSWSALGTGLVGPVPTVAAAVNGLGVFDDGHGPALYAAGNLLQAGGQPANRIAKWDGSQWSALGAGLNQGAQALAVFDDGSGDALYVGGSFTMAGSTPGTVAIAKWDGSEWTAVGGGMTSGSCNVLITWNDGTGTALYAGGTFPMAGGVAGTSRVAKWDGVQWSALATGMDGPNNPRVNTLVVWDDGGGPALFAGGLFTSAGGRLADNLARWRENGWLQVGGGTDNNIIKMATFDDGRGEALYVGGSFQNVGGATPMPAGAVARWDGTSWEALGTGLSHPTVTTASAMSVFNDGRGESLFISGGFTTAGGLPANNIVRWGCEGCYANCDGSTAPPVLNVNDFICFQSRYAAADPAANCDGSTTPPVLNVNDFICFQGKYAAGCP